MQNPCMFDVVVMFLLFTGAMDPGRQEDIILWVYRVGYMHRKKLLFMDQAKHYDHLTELTQKTAAIRVFTTILTTSPMFIIYYLFTVLLI